ncbi:hypothetical protein RB595_004676 [Gaeumannomyces hyphopodioides]
MADPPPAGSPSDPPTIAKAGKQCFDQFQKCYDLGGPINILPKSLLEDQLTRFTIWTNMMGVFAGARASMDHRLREAPEVRDTVLSVLEGLTEHLETYSMLLQSQSKDVPEGDGRGSRAPERPLRDMAGEISMLFRLSNAIRKASRESQNIEAAKNFHILDGEGNDEEPLLRQRFLWHIRSQLAADIQDPAEKTAAEELTQRLASTMLLRRKRVMYRKGRYGSKKPIETVKMIQPPQVDTHVAEEPIQSLLRTFRPTENVAAADSLLVAPNLLSSRATSVGGSATTLHQDRYKKASSPSSISGTRTIPLSYNKKGNALQFPQRPLRRGGVDKKYQEKKQARWQVFVKDVSRIFATEREAGDHEELPVSQTSKLVAAVEKLDKEMKSDFQKCVDAVAEFTCPICFHALNREYLTDAKEWESHVASDLDAYVCLFKDCESPEELYTHSSTWTSHMRKHARRWRCITKSHGRRDFDTREEYTQHIQHDHPRRATGGRLDVLADSSTWTPEHLFPSCPLCGEMPDSTDMPGVGCSEGHIAHHLRALALTSLPKEEKYDPENPHYERLSSNASQGSIRPTIAEGLEEKQQEESQTNQPHTSEEMVVFPATQEEEEERARSEWEKATLVQQQPDPKMREFKRTEIGDTGLEEMDFATLANSLPSDDVLRSFDFDAFRRGHGAEDLPQLQQEEKQIGPSSPYWPYEMLLEYASPPKAGERESDPIIQAFFKRQRGGPRAPEAIFESKEVFIALRTLRKLVGKQEADALRSSIEQLIKTASSPAPPTKAEDIVHGKVDETQQALLAEEHAPEDYTDAIMDWLSPADPSGNAGRERSIRNRATDGLLWANNPGLQAWISGSRRYLWLRLPPSTRGKKIPGTALIDVLLSYADHPNLRFYFDMHDEKRRTLDHMLRVFVSQAYTQGISPHAKAHIAGSFKIHDDGTDQPTTSTLSDIVDTLLAEQADTLIFLENLDESIAVWEIVRWIERIVNRGLARLILTSQPIPKLGLIPSLFGKGSCISLDDGRTSEADMHAALMSRLMEDSRSVSKNLPAEFLENICSRIVDRAGGMFVQAYEQVDKIAACRSPEEINRILEDMPDGRKTMPSTHLGDVPTSPDDTRKSQIEELLESEDATRLLQFVLYSERPISLLEAMDIMATRVETEPRGFNPGRRPLNKAVIIKQCRGMLSFTPLEDPESMMHGDAEILGFSHPSVKEGLLQQDQFSATTAYISITRTCLSYLTAVDGGYAGIKAAFPLAHYAAEFWMSSAAKAEMPEDIVREAIKFLQNERTRRLWCRIYSESYTWLITSPDIAEASALYHTCAAGFKQAAACLVGDGADISAPGGLFGSALQVAAWKGHADIVHLLLDNGADVNRQGGYCGSALQAASHLGHKDIVQLLLDKGADANARGDKFGSALQVASYYGWIDIVRLLLDKGADVNLQGGHFGSALNSAISKGHLDIAQLLLDRGAVKSPPHAAAATAKGELEQDAQQPANGPSLPPRTVDGGSGLGDGDGFELSDGEASDTGGQERGMQQVIDGSFRRRGAANSDPGFAALDTGGYSRGRPAGQATGASRDGQGSDVGGAGRTTGGAADAGGTAGRSWTLELTPDPRGWGAYVRR